MATTRRFAMLLLMMLMACPAILQLLALAQWSGPVYLDCMRAVGARPFADDHENAGALLAGADTVAACESRMASIGARVSTAGTGAVLCVAFMVYLCMPVWLRRVGSLLPVRKQRALYDDLLVLTGRAGLTRTPEFVIAPRGRTAAAVVFGRTGAYTVCLHAGLLKR